MGGQVIAQIRTSGKRKMGRDANGTSHPLSLSQSAAIPTTVAMESGSWKNRLSQALTKTLARGHFGLFLEINFHTPYLQKVPDNRH